MKRKLRPLPLCRIELTGGFWMQRQRAFLDGGLEAQFRQLEATGRIENFRRVARKESGTHQGLRFDDSDVYKWLEACAYALAAEPSAAIAQRAKEVAEVVAAAQESDGYLNTFFQLQHPDKKWRNLGAMHEMYCAGHLIEAGIALFEATGDPMLLGVAIRLADHIASRFGPGKRRGYCGHQELEIALIRLSATTGEPSYRRLAAWMVHERGRKPSPFEEELSDPVAMELSPYQAGLVCENGKYSGEYLQDHAPLVEHTDVVGHAVRAMYFYCAATELLPEHPEYLPVLQRAWNSLTRKRMYVTGGIGPSEHNEGFTVDFDLPNRSAYAETCASVALAFWARRLLEHTGTSQFADVMERAMFNGALSGVSLDGSLYFYTNPLESRGEHQRVPWFRCACCPPNIARMVLAASDAMVSVSDDPPGFWVHIPGNLQAEAELGGVPVRLAIEGEYPWSGFFAITLDPAEESEFEVRVRMPDWAASARFRAPGGESPFEENGYAVFRRRWRPGDAIEVEWEMNSVWVHADPRVLDDLGRVALTRGPLVYCVEQADLGAPPQMFSASTKSPPTAHWRPDLLGGVITLEAEGKLARVPQNGALYSPRAFGEDDARAILVPYYTWNNRGPGGMQVWLRKG